jgi:hypothetical protein
MTEEEIETYKYKRNCKICQAEYGSDYIKDNGFCRECRRKHGNQ